MMKWFRDNTHTHSSSHGGACITRRRITRLLILRALGDECVLLRWAYTPSVPYINKIKVGTIYREDRGRLEDSQIKNSFFKKGIIIILFKKHNWTSLKIIADMKWIS